MAGRSRSDSAQHTMHLASSMRNPQLKNAILKQKRSGGQDSSIAALEKRRQRLKENLREWASSKPGGMPSVADCEAKKSELQEYQDIKDRIAFLSKTRQDNGESSSDDDDDNDDDNDERALATGESESSMIQSFTSFFGSPAAPAANSWLSFSPALLGSSQTTPPPNAADSWWEMISGTSSLLDASSSPSTTSSSWFESFWDAPLAQESPPGSASLQRTQPAWMQKWVEKEAGSGRINLKKKSGDKIARANYSPKSKSASPLHGSEQIIDKAHGINFQPENVVEVNKTSEEERTPEQVTQPVANSASLPSTSPPTTTLPTDSTATVKDQKEESKNRIKELIKRRAEERKRKVANQTTVEDAACRAPISESKLTSPSNTAGGDEGVDAKPNVYSDKPKYNQEAEVTSGTDRSSVEALRNKQVVTSNLPTAEQIVTLPLAVSAAARATASDLEQTRDSEGASVKDGCHVNEAVAAGESKVADKEEQRRKQELMAKLDRAIRTFNINAKKGIRFIVDNGMVENTPDDVADFLVSTPGLNKAHIGEYLGDPKDFNLAVLSRVASIVIDPEDKDVQFIAAIRAFLARFRLPGEAQKIDRIVEAFANAFYKANSKNAPGDANNDTYLFASASTAHILAFSVIMLNTDAHSPNMRAKERMTLEQFVRNNRGIDDGKDIPRPMLELIYHDITKHEILTVVDRDDGGNLFVNPKREGWMEKQGSNAWDSYKRRYFILNGSLLYYFKTEEDIDPIGFVMLNDVTASLESASFQKQMKRADEIGLGHLGLKDAEASSNRLSSDDAMHMEIKEWVTTSAVLSSFLLRENDEPEQAGISMGRKVASAALTSERLVGKHATFKANMLGFSLRSRGRQQLPVVDKMTDKHLKASILEEGDVLVSCDGKKLNAFENPLGEALKLIRDPAKRPITLSFAASATESNIVASSNTSTKSMPPKGVGFVFGDEASGVRSSSDGGAANETTTIRIVPALGAKIKSARFKNGELTPGKHKVINLRCSSFDVAKSWVDDLNSCVAHSICAV